jgi:hypothetical protein
MIQSFQDCRGIRITVASVLRHVPRRGEPSLARIFHSQTCSADFQVCGVAGFQTGDAAPLRHAADLEIGDTAGLETCATPALPAPVKAVMKYPGSDILIWAGIKLNPLGDK